MIIVAKLHYDIVSIKWISSNRKATIDTEREKVIVELGQPYMEKNKENTNGISLIYDSYNSIIISEANN